jgi:hypothetical protein
MTTSRPAKAIVPMVAACLALGLAACSMDDVQFNGGVFDAVGLSDSAKPKSGNAKLAERAPLVIPPTLDRLPAPGEGAPPSDIAGIQDHDAKEQLSREELEARHAAFCKENYEKPMAHGDNSVAGVEGPLGPCRASVLTAIKKWNAGEDIQEGQ